MTRVRLGLLVGMLTSLTGCDGFFLSNAPSGGTSTTGDYVYVVNQTSDTLSAFGVGSAVLTGVSGSPYGLTSGLVPASVAVTRGNSYVYVGGSGAIECFSIGSGGALTLVNASAASASAKFVSLETSPDGQWLFGLDSIGLGVYVFQINTSTGALSLKSTIAFSGGGSGGILPSMIRIAPNGLYVIAALGTGGDTIFSFATGTGALTQIATLAVPAGDSDNALTFDAGSANVYFARGGTSTGTSGVSSFSVGASGALTGVQSLALSGNTPFSAILDKTGTYLYTANRADGTVSGFSVATGNLTVLASSPYSSGATTTALALDNSGKYIVAAAAGGGNDLTLYSLDAITGGKLDAVGTYTSGTDPAGAIAIAATH